MGFRFCGWLLLAISLAACDQNVQQALAPDPRLLPSPTNSTITPSPIASVAASPLVPTPTSSPSSTPTPSATAPITSINSQLADLVELQVFTTPEASLSANSLVSRRNYARWLFAAHNAIYHNHTSQQIKLATPEAQPVFTDVPATHPDFPIIQGLAEAGIIPSPLSGDSLNIAFSGELPVTREQLIVWKVPLDRRQALPPATAAQVQKSWGFQDTAKITPQALSAILADHASGDHANIRRAFGYTTLFQPQKPVTFAEMVATIWYFGASDGQSAHTAFSTTTPSPSP